MKFCNNSFEDYIINDDNTLHLYYNKIYPDQTLSDSV